MRNGNATLAEGPDATVIRISRRPTPDQLRAAVERHGTPLLLLSIGAVRERLGRLAAALPGVELCHSVKTLPHPAVIAAIAQQGACFRVGSARELDLVAAAGAGSGRCVHTPPLGTEGAIGYALTAGCRSFVIDSEGELATLRRQAPADCSVLVRLAMPGAEYGLPGTLGAPTHEAARLLALAADAGLRVRGLSFHLGEDPAGEAFVTALRACRELFDLARDCGVHLDTLDIGGGFPIAARGRGSAIEDYCRPLLAELARSFDGTRVVADPGRFVSAPAMTLVTSVIGQTERAGQPWYYIDHGVPGSFARRRIGHRDGELISLRELEGECVPHEMSFVAGPTCDLIDVVEREAPLPPLEQGDLLVTPTIGAYSWASAAEVDFLARARVVDRE